MASSLCVSPVSPIMGRLTSALQRHALALSWRQQGWQHGFLALHRLTESELKLKVSTERRAHQQPSLSLRPHTGNAAGVRRAPAELTPGPGNRRRSHRCPGTGPRARVSAIPSGGPVRSLLRSGFRPLFVPFWLDPVVIPHKQVFGSGSIDVLAGELI